MNKSEQSLTNQWDTNKCYQHKHNGNPRGEESKKRAEKVHEEIMATNFTNLMKNIHLHIQEVQKTPHRVNSKRSTPRHIVMKLLKAEGKDRILKIAKGGD